MKIACVIAYYNGSEFIERSLQSAFQQTLPFHEVLVVNDGSSQTEKNNLAHIANHFPEAKIFHKENGGQGSARNFGVNNSESDYICFLDQDDFYLSQHNEILASGFRANDKHLGFTYADLWEGEESGEIVRYGMIKDHATHPKTSLIQCLSEDMFILPSASMIKKEAYMSVNGFDEQFTGYEDDDLFLRLFRKGWAHKFIDDCVTVWCINNKSTSYSMKMDESRLRYISKLISSYPDDPPKHRYYIRDVILPRFKPVIASRAVDAFMKGDPNTNRLAGILGEFIRQIKISSPGSELSELEEHYDNLCMHCQPEHREAHQALPLANDEAPTQSIPPEAKPASGAGISYNYRTIGGKTSRFLDVDALRKARLEAADNIP